MAELSKTARASMGKVVKEAHVETPEESIKKIRLGLTSVPTEYIPAHRVKALLDAYDELLARIGTRADAEYWCKEAERLIAKYETESTITR
jgi:hypothetical protein